jgi:F-type H+-transporting ATPase subunit epsilon
MAETASTTEVQRDRLQCVVVTPEATVVDTTARFVALPLFDGEVGISPLHSPMIGRLGFGEMRITDDNGTHVYYVDGGFVQVADNVVSVITNRSVLAEELNIDTASEQLDVARQTAAAGDEPMAIRDRRVGQARAQLHVARKAK